MIMKKDELQGELFGAPKWSDDTYVDYSATTSIQALLNFDVIRAYQKNSITNSSSSWVEDPFCRKMSESMSVLRNFERL